LAKKFDSSSIFASRARASEGTGASGIGGR
jgi:hypothetical protein